jgi:CheY-like chemotaxis protein
MLGVTSYQEALRTLGRLADQAGRLSIREHAEWGFVEVSTPDAACELDALELEAIVIASVAQRGWHQNAGVASDTLRAVGETLDHVHALDLCLDLQPTGLCLRFADEHGARHELTYPADDLPALQREAAARRNGHALSRVLVLQARPDSAACIYKALVAEFSVQVLPTRYAHAVAQSAEPPNLVLVQASECLPEALRVLRSGSRTADVPVVILASPEHDAGASELFAAGADDLLQEPVQPAQLRARLRTWLLRGHADPYCGDPHAPEVH